MSSDPRRAWGRVSLLALALTLGLAAPTAAQAPAPADPAADGPPAPPPGYSYAPDGRRDPFVSLVRRGQGDAVRAGSGPRPDGVRGLAVGDLVVRGIVQSRHEWVAMVAAPNGRTYVVRAGDRLLDGTIRAITSQALVILQEVNDPLSLDKQREVRKYLRGGGEGNQ